MSKAPDPVRTTKRHLYGLVASNLAVVTVIVAFLAHYLHDQARIAERIVDYHSPASRSAQGALIATYFLADELLRHGGNGPQGPSEGLAHDSGIAQKPTAELLSTLAAEGELLAALQAKFEDEEFASVTGEALRLLDGALLFGSADGHTDEDIAKHQELLDLLSTRLQQLSRLHLAARDRITATGFFGGSQGLYGLASLVGLIMFAGFVAGVGVVRNVTATATDRERALQALRESEQRFALAFRLSPGMTAITDIETGVHTEVNDKWVETMGYSREETIGRTPTELGIWASPKDRRRAASLLRKEGRFRDIEVQFRTRDGALRDFLISAEPFPAGARPHLLFVAHEITERRRIEAELRDTAERLEKSQKVGKIGSWVWEFDDDREWWSDEVYRMFGLEVGAIAPNGFDFIDFVHPGDRERVRAGLQEAILKGAPFSQEYRVRRADGREIMVFEQSEIEYDANGKPNRLRGVAQDVTGRKKAELALRETKDRLEEAQRLGQMGSWTWNPVEDVEWWSDEHYRVFGLEPGSVALSGFTFLKYVHPDDLDRVEKTERHAAETHTPFTIEYRIVRPDGAVRTVAEHGEWIEDDISGNPQWRGVVQDITERKQIELELARLNAELEQRVEERTAELRAAQGELVKRERLATLGQLTATVSHELRNPLGAIRTSLFVMEQKIPREDPRLAKTFERINRNVIRCDNIIDELLDFTRMRELTLQRLPLDECLDSVLAEQPAPPGISVDKRYNMSGVTVAADPDKLRRVVINLFENACQAMAPNGEAEGVVNGRKHQLTISTRRRGDRAEIVFEDTGPGISDKALDRIFEPLFSTKNFGVGLGLPIVLQIMEQHGGGVEAANGEKGGARFVLWLPLVAEKETDGKIPPIETDSTVV